MQGRAQPCPRPATQGQTDLLQGPGQWYAAPRVPAGQRGCLLGKGSPRAPPTGAEEATDVQVDYDLPPTQRFVGNAAAVTAVDPTRATATGRTTGGRSGTPGLNVDDARQHQQPLDVQVNQLR